MKQLSKKYYIFTFFTFLILFSVAGQNSDELWIKTSELEKRSFKKVKRKSVPNHFSVYKLNVRTLKDKLANTAKRKGKLLNSGVILSFPTGNGNLDRYQVFEASIMEEGLQKKYPNIKSYIGKGVDNPSSVVRFSVTSLGLHAMVIQNSKNAIYIDPYTSNKESYIIYTKKSLPDISQFKCMVVESSDETTFESSNLSAKNENADDGILRTFRLAIATTGEYSQFHLNNQGISSNATDAEKKEAVLSAIAVTMTRVNGIFERDVALTMVLVEKTTDIIFLDAATDGFTNNEGGILIDESQTVIDTNIGNSNYDIGHTFSTGGGGLAQLNSPCTNNKARGVTGLSNPIADPYAIDFVAHEMGHQFGAHHTFNSDSEGCGNDNRNDGTAVEPGSGSTIMSYADLCTPYNVQDHSDAYFHLVSIREMWENITTGNSSCGVKTNMSNNAPLLETLSNYTIPISTPFILNANATDIDGDPLTYTWEQLDIEITTHPLESTATGGPAFRSIAPDSSSMRYFPNQNTVIGGNLSNTWEVLPSVGRTMRFGVNVRDNNIVVGQTASEETIITVDDSSGPFKMTSQITSESWDEETSQTITWDVANTNVSPVNCSFVNILLSTDGGFTYPVTLASNVENNGSHVIEVPGYSTSNGRIKIESVGNVFYTMNSADITIQSSEFSMSFDSFSEAVCSPNTVIYTFTYNTFLGFNEITTFSATGNPAGTTVSFNPETATADNTVVEITVSDILVDDVGNHTISVTGTSSSMMKNENVTLNVYSSVINTPNLVSPEDNVTDVLKPYVLSWEDDINALNYLVEISTDNTFTTIAEYDTVTTNLYSTLSLLANTGYFWRVKSINDCGESNYSLIYNFTSANEVCDSYTSIDTPLNIPDDNPAGIISSIPVFEDKTITDINVTVNITHSYNEDLILSLISPIGTVVNLSIANGDNSNNYINTIFDDSATNSIKSGVGPFTGTFAPQENLSKLNNEESYGNWTLKVVDLEGGDEGVIENWSIEVCGIPIISNDNDKDGVNNDKDLCPNTPLNSNVDATGCPIFTLPPDNFSVEVISETCPNKNNGQILISASKPHTYNTNIDGIDYVFTNTNNLLVENLAPATYTFCIGVDVSGEESFEQCFNVEVKSGEGIKATSSVISNKVYVEIEKGTAPFILYINGEEEFKTNSLTFSVTIKDGDFLEVKTAISCEGVYAKTIRLLDGIVAYPNPTKGEFIIALPASQKEVVIALYTIHSQLISVKSYPVVYGKVHVSLENKPAGVYFANVHLEEPITLKILKY